MPHLISSKSASLFALFSHESNQYFMIMTMETLHFQMTLLIRPLPLINKSFSLSPPGRLERGRTRIPFSFLLESSAASSASPLFVTFHGRNIQIMYAVSAEVCRPVLRGGSLETGLCEFVVETRVNEDSLRTVPASSPVNFELTEDGQELGPHSGALRSQGFSVIGCLDRSAWFMEQPLTGWIKVVSSPVRILSIDLELCRLEGCTTSEGQRASEASIIQSTQVIDGNVSIGSEVPIFAVLPRLYCCPSVQARTFSISFLVRILVYFAPIDSDYPMIAVRTVPIQLIRGGAIGSL